jgi:chemotaxis protein MotA
MDVSTWIGIGAGLSLLMFAMVSGGSLGVFFDPPSLGLVLGGTLAATLIYAGLDALLGALRVGAQAFVARDTNGRETIAQVIGLATKARQEGLVALEHEPIRDSFLARGVRLGVDGLGPDAIRSILEQELLGLRQRHQLGQAIFRFMGTTAPSMGMVGTLVGLVQMLRSLEDPASIGPAMALALVTTLYGAVFAFLLCLPIAAKLEQRTQQELAEGSLAIAGVEAILRGENALSIRPKLEAFLSGTPRGRGGRGR